MRLVVAGLLLLVSGSLAAQEPQPWCATARPPRESREWFADFAREAHHSSRPKATIRIPIAFHVVTDGKNGMISPQQIAILIQNLNWAYRGSPFSFYLYRADLIKNKAWYNNCVVNASNLKKLRKRAARDVRYYVNVYSCKLGQPGFYGVATFPPGYPVPNPGLSYLQGIAVDPVVLGSDQFPFGLALAHEMGHYLGLLHTFETAFNEGQAECVDPGDFIGDTPTQAGNTFGACPIGRDSCPALAGSDDIPNLMNYATDECWDHFTPVQADAMFEALKKFRPTLGTR